MVNLNNLCENGFLSKGKRINKGDQPIMQTRKWSCFLKNLIIFSFLTIFIAPCGYAISYYPHGFYLEAGTLWGVLDIGGFDVKPKTSILAQENQRKKGFGYQGSVGYSFKKYPITLALNYTKRPDLKYSPSPIFVGDRNKLTSKLKNNTVMLNGFYDVPLDRFVLYAMLGAGAAFNKVTLSATDPGPYSSTKSYRKLAWQVGAGVRFNITNNFFVTAGYQHVILGDAKWIWGQKSLKSSGLTSDEFSLTVSYYFGHPKRPVPGLAGDKGFDKIPVLIEDS